MALKNKTAIFAIQSHCMSEYDITQCRAKVYTFSIIATPNIKSKAKFYFLF